MQTPNVSNIDSARKILDNTSDMVIQKDSSDFRKGSTEGMAIENPVQMLPPQNIQKSLADRYDEKSTSYMTKIDR